MIHRIYQSFDGIILQCFNHPANMREKKIKKGVKDIKNSTKIKYFLDKLSIKELI